MRRPTIVDARGKHAGSPRQASGATIYTPKDYDLNAILGEIVAIVAKAAG